MWEHFAFLLAGGFWYPSTILLSIEMREDLVFGTIDWRRTNVQQLTCNIDLACSFYYIFFSFVLIELKPFVLKGKVLGEKGEKL